MDISVQHAAIQAPQRTEAWLLTIDNDENWRTRVTGHAYVMSAAISAADLRDMITLAPEPGYTCTTISREFRPIIKLTVFKLGTDGPDQYQTLTLDRRLVSIGP